MNYEGAPRFWRVVTWCVDAPDNKHHYPRPLREQEAQSELQSALKDPTVDGELEPITIANAVRFGIFRTVEKRFIVPMGSGQRVRTTERAYDATFDGNVFNSQAEAEEFLHKLDNGLQL